jgi:hypothetical protein
MWRGGVRAMSDFDLHQWFGHEELEPCPACGEDGQIVLPASGQRLCIVCGYLSPSPPRSADATTDDPSSR